MTKDTFDQIMEFIYRSESLSGLIKNKIRKRDPNRESLDSIKLEQHAESIFQDIYQKVCRRLEKLDQTDSKDLNSDDQIARLWAFHALTEEHGEQALRYFRKKRSGRSHSTSKEEKESASILDQEATRCFGSTIIERLVEDRFRSIESREHISTPLQRAFLEGLSDPQDCRQAKLTARDIQRAYLSGEAFSVIPEKLNLSKRETNILLRSDVRQALEKTARNQVSRTIEDDEILDSIADTHEQWQPEKAYELEASNNEVSRNTIYKYLLARLNYNHHEIFELANELPMQYRLEIDALFDEAVDEALGPKLSYLAPEFNLFLGTIGQEGESIASIHQKFGDIPRWKPLTKNVLTYRHTEFRKLFKIRLAAYLVNFD